jgi:hypothetical protein
MVDPISSNSTSSSKSAMASQAPAKPVVQPETTQVKAGFQTSDTVELSQAAQAQLLRQQGQSIPEIAMQLGLDIKTVTAFFPQSL